MKKTILAFALIAVSALTSCKKEEPISQFDIIVTQTTTASPEIPGYPQTVTSFSEVSCTESEASTAAKRMTSRTTSYSGGITITVDSKGEYQICRGASGHPSPKKPTGSRY
jgi:hypothetical protein